VTAASGDARSVVVRKEAPSDEVGRRGGRDSGERWSEGRGRVWGG